MKFSANDAKQIEAHSLSVESVKNQLDRFRKGFPYLQVVAPASVGKGIRVPDKAEQNRLVDLYKTVSPKLKVVKFVPASGAATRMFKDLYAFLNEGKRSPGVDRLLGQLERFPFYEALKAFLPAGASEKEIVGAIVGDGLHYGTKPKGLVLFHRYDGEVRTAVEEHLVEGALYAASKGEVRIHFTVSPEHRADFERLIALVAPRYEERFGVHYEISYSIQKPSTDTIAANPDGTPFRNDDGTLLFRPAGHGALIGNLGEIDADLIFIKNIDNVTVDARKADTVHFKRMLAGLLLALQARVFGYLRAMDEGQADLAEVARFIREELSTELPEVCDERLLRSLLDRPIRVCGMVRNEGEPGGGPFWVRNEDGTVSLQIAESSQIAPEDAGLMRQATHFNPVDLVCGTKNYRGERFDLERYVDPATGFISRKSKDGRELLAQELPGLWNGAMARWITVFAEVPVSTFTPVKEVGDLLRAEHQA